MNFSILYMIMNMVNILGCHGGHLTYIFGLIMCISGTYYVHFLDLLCAFVGLIMCIYSCLDVNSLKRNGVDCIVPVNCTICAALKRIGIARKTLRRKRGERGRRSDLV